MSARRRREPAILLSASVLLAGCYLSSGPPSPATDGSSPDGGARDGGAPGLDADAGPGVDGGMCEWFGSTRLCGLSCGLPCPRGTWCADRGLVYDTCRWRSDQCGIDLSTGHAYACREGRTCLTAQRPMDGYDDLWGGGCVDPEYCRWLVAHPEVRPELRCRYSEGTVFESGPPAHECAPGAYELGPFCGGACGDACLGEVGSCVGVSETRGFGVCSIAGEANRRCISTSPASLRNELNACRWSLGYIGGLEGEVDCACMVLSPMELPEYADRGWPVSRQSCLAYQARYPGEVRCFDENGTVLR